MKTNTHQSNLKKKKENKRRKIERNQVLIYCNLPYQVGIENQMRNRFIIKLKSGMI